MLPSASDEAKLFATNFSKNSTCDDSGISLPIFLNLKLLTPKMVNKVIANLDLSKRSGTNIIPAVVLVSLNFHTY